MRLVVCAILAIGAVGCRRPSTTYERPFDLGEPACADCGRDLGPAPDSDGGTACVNGCFVAGATECEGGQIRQCVANARGCLDWTTPTACGSGACGDAQSCRGCSDACARGQSECNNGRLRTCAVDGSGCLQWSDESSCPTGQCRDATSCQPCVDQCHAGDARCQSTSVETCALQANGCYDWSAPLACGFGDNQFPTCANGACGAGCNSGFADCDGTAGNGCEIDVQTDPANCGACGAACGTFGGTAQCNSGHCSITCSGTFLDCNGLNRDGCEADTSSDPHNCGACGHDCLGGGCSHGACQVVLVASGQSSPRSIALDDGFVYWTNEGTTADNYSDGSVRRAPKSGTPSPTPLAHDVYHPWGIAVDDTQVFYTSLGLSNDATGVVWRVAKGGGSDPVTVQTTQALPQGILVDASHVYWANGGSYSTSGNVNQYDHDGSVVRANKDGTGLTALASSQNEPVALAFTGWVTSDGPGLVWVDRGGYTSTDGNVSLGIGSGAPTPLATAQPFPEVVAADATYAYYSVSNGGVRKVSQLGTPPNTPTVLQDANGGTIGGIAVDDNFVYFTNGTVWRVAKSGGAAVSLASGVYGSRGVAVDGSAIYWVDATSGDVLKLAK